jgi:hypothetical protein
MSELFKDLLHTTLECYRQGFRKPIQITLTASGEGFDHHLQAVINIRLPLKEQLLMRRCEQARRQGLLAARRGHIATADQLLGESRAILHSEKLSVESSLICKSFQAATEAYLDYRRGAFDQARARVHEALAIDVVLEEEYGYKILHLHRVQLVHNLMRIDARCARFEDAIDLGCRLLSYLEGSSEILPVPGSWDSAKIASLPPEIVAAMFAQVTSEIALVLAGKDRRVARDLFLVAIRHAQLEATGNCHHYPRPHAWFQIKQSFVDNNVDIFLDRASQFLADGRGDTPLLWYAIAVDLVVWCDDLDLPEAELVKLEIARDAITWEYLPPTLRPLLAIHPKIRVRASPIPV